MDLTRSRQVGIVIFVCGLFVLLLAVLQQKSYLFTLFGLQLLALATGLCYEKVLPVSIIFISILFSLLAAEPILKFYKDDTNSPKYAGDYTKHYFVPSDLGNQATPGVHSSIKYAANNQLIYNAIYTIGDDGFRITPGNHSLKNERVNFFGCSFMFGEGLNDNQTLPYFVAKQSPFLVKNFGFHGYGPHQALAILTSHRDTSGKTNFFLTAPWHAERSACVPSYSTGSPRYYLENGKVIRDGVCGGSKSKNIFNKILRKSRLYTLISDFTKQSLSQDKQIDLYLALIEQMNVLSKERAQDFLVGFIKADEDYFTGSYSNDLIVKKLTDHGVRVVDLTLSDKNETLDSKYYIKIDKHPSSLANEERAKIVLHALH